MNITSEISTAITVAVRYSELHDKANNANQSLSLLRFALFAGFLTQEEMDILGKAQEIAAKVVSNSSTWDATQYLAKMVTEPTQPAIVVEEEVKPEIKATEAKEATVSLNENEMIALAACAEEVMASTSGEFGWSQDVYSSKLTKNQMKGYLAQLVIKGMIDQPSQDKDFYGQFHMTKAGVLALGQDLEKYVTYQ